MRFQIVCDICQIRMGYQLSPVTKQRLDVNQFIKDHHGCDPKRGVQIVSMEIAPKFKKYTSVEDKEFLGLFDTPNELQ